MKLTPLEHIASLNLDAFLLIMQSILQSKMGKYSENAHTWTEAQNFAKFSFQDLNCNDTDRIAICQAFMQMFNLEHSIPSTTECFGNYVEKLYKSWRSGPLNITFFTSGSTGKPKPCTHPELHLRQELIGIAPLLENRKSALVTVPLHHLYGFSFGLLLPMTLQIPIRLEAPIPTAIAHQVKDSDLVIGVPLLYNNMARLDSLQSRNSFLMTGTAPMPADTFKCLLAAGFKMIECFGSSEMGVMCWRLDPTLHFTLLPQFNRLEPHANQTVDTVRRTFPEGKTQDFTLQDNIDWQDSRHLLPRGRKDSAVQVGGVNVYPEYVSRVLSKHPSVELCTVRLMRPDEGQQLKAFIVLKPNYSQDTARKELRAYVKQHLKVEEQPARFTFGIDFPRSAIGKPADW